MTPVLAQLSALKASLETSYRLANLESTVYDTLSTSPYRTQMVAAINAVVSRAPMMTGDTFSGTQLLLLLVDSFRSMARLEKWFADSRSKGVLNTMTCWGDHFDQQQRSGQGFRSRYA
jgi:hypothetical protein